MRTTLNIAEDVLYAVKERARRENRSAGEVLSDLARKAMTGATEAGRAIEDESLHGFRPFPRRGAAISNELIDRLREEEDD
jgi:hypothetical protein